VARIRDVIFDSPRPARIARFWAAVLDGYDVAPYDDAELARLRAAGITDLEDDPSVLVEPTTGGLPRLFFQLVPDAKRPEPITANGEGPGKNRVHLDLSADDPAAELVRLTELGATVVAEHETLTVLVDPDGNVFCLSRR
jgi:hypothetical protein